MKNKVCIKLLILDLDNTLYDWVRFFVPSFYRMIDSAIEILQVDKRTLLKDIRMIHQKYGNTEQPFALLETETVKNRYPGKSRAERAKILNPALHQFNRERDKLLKLYPGVLETLRTIKDGGCSIVAYTEAVVVNSMFRIEKLKLHQFISRIYAPKSRGLGHPESKDSYVEKSPNFLGLLPESHRKPNPQVLQNIIKEFALPPEEVLYVGDSITKDISMAKQAGTWAAWAKYGRVFDKELWDKLVYISHWTQDDIDRELKLRKDTEGILPDHELEEFTDLVKFYEFCPIHPSNTNKELIARLTLSRNSHKDKFNPLPQPV